MDSAHEDSIWCCVWGRAARRVPIATNGDADQNNEEYVWTIIIQLNEKDVSWLFTGFTCRKRIILALNNPKFELKY